MALARRSLMVAPITDGRVSRRPNDGELLTEMKESWIASWSGGSPEFACALAGDGVER